jgi:hypothetical protein
LAQHQLNQQCSATAKSTGKQCERRVVGAPVCWVHGLNAPQVRAKQQQRIALAEAQAAVPATVVVQREPEEILLTALRDVDAVLQQIKAELRGGVVNPILLQLAGDWLDRLGRLGKVVVDGEIAEKLERRVGWIAQDRAAQLTALLAAIVRTAPLSAEQRLAVWESRFDGLRLIADGQAPARMLGDETVRFTAELQVAAAREKALAKGLPWGDSEPDSDDVEWPLLFGGGEVA